jgi:hypothetical protein
VAVDGAVLTGAGLATCSVECEPDVHPGIVKNSSNEVTRLLQHEYPDCKSRRRTIIVYLSGLRGIWALHHLVSIVSFGRYKGGELPPGWNMQSPALLLFSSNVFPQPVLVQMAMVG